jgi:hypothetical protein
MEFKEGKGSRVSGKFASEGGGSLDQGKQAESCDQNTGIVEICVTEKEV